MHEMPKHDVELLLDSGCDASYDVRATGGLFFYWKRFENRSNELNY